MGCSSTLREKGHPSEPAGSCPLSQFHPSQKRKAPLIWALPRLEHKCLLHTGLSLWQAVSLRAKMHAGRPGRPTQEVALPRLQSFPGRGTAGRLGCAWHVAARVRAGYSIGRKPCGAVSQALPGLGLSLLCGVAGLGLEHLQTQTRGGRCFPQMTRRADDRHSLPRWPRPGASPESPRPPHPPRQARRFVPSRAPDCQCELTRKQRAKQEKGPPCRHGNYFTGSIQFMTLTHHKAASEDDEALWTDAGVRSGRQGGVRGQVHARNSLVDVIWRHVVEKALDSYRLTALPSKSQSVSCFAMSGYFKVRNARRFILESILKHTHLVTGFNTWVVSDDLFVCWLLHLRTNFLNFQF